jgi:hypothetical protein
MVTRAGGRMVKRDMFPDRPDMSWQQDEPEPLAAIIAAVALRNAASASLARSARNAREDGRTWEEIGEAAGCERNPVNGDTPGTTVFYLLASDYGSGPSVTWACLACRKTVFDRGPEVGHPADAEQGHAPGCARLAETIRAYEQM